MRSGLVVEFTGMSFVVSNLDHHFHEQRFSGIHVDGRLGGATQDTLRAFVTALDQVCICMNEKNP